MGDGGEARKSKAVLSAMFVSSIQGMTLESLGRAAGSAVGSIGN